MLDTMNHLPRTHINIKILQVISNDLCPVQGLLVYRKCQPLNALSLCPSHHAYGTAEALSLVFCYSGCNFREWNSLRKMNLGTPWSNLRHLKMLVKMKMGNGDQKLQNRSQEKPEKLGRPGCKLTGPLGGKRLVDCPPETLYLQRSVTHYFYSSPSNSPLNLILYWALERSKKEIYHL